MKALAVVLSLLSLTAFSAMSEDKSDELKQAEANIKPVLGKLQINYTDMTISEVDGLVEVLTERGLYYFSKDGKHLISGKIYDVTGRPEDITEKSLAKVRVSGMKDFENSMIVFPAKEEKYQVTVFTDTSCGYCRKLHSEMEGYNDLGITVRYLAFPRSGTQGSTYKELTSIWCAVDQQTAMTKAKNGDRTPQPQTKMCDMPIAEQYQMGMKVGVSGTPAIVLDNGTMIPGYQGPADLLATLASAQ